MYFEICFQFKFVSFKISESDVRANRYWLHAIYVHTKKEHTTVFNHDTK